MSAFGGFAALAYPEITKITTAVSQGGKAWKDLSPAEKAVGDQLKGLKEQFHDLQLAIQPEVLKAFSTSMRIVKDLMPAFKPLAESGRRRAGHVPGEDGELAGVAVRAQVRQLAGDHGAAGHRQLR